MFPRRWQILLVGLVIGLSVFLACPAARGVDASAAIAWYDTLGYPDAKALPYVRVATGLYMIKGNQPPENRFTEGFLVSEDADGFTVFICSVSDFQDSFGDSEPYPLLTTVHFVRQTDGPIHKRVDYQVLDFPKVAADVLARVSDVAGGPPEMKAREAIYSARYPGLRPVYDLQGGRPLPHRARIFAFACACQQKGRADIASPLFEACANIPDAQTRKIDPGMLRDALQRQIGEAVLNKAEEDFGRPSVSLAELLKTYEPFAARFPASPRVAYAQEAADLLRQMIAEEAAHHPKPLEAMSPEEQVTENIHQLRNLGWAMWIMHAKYPLVAGRTGKEITPVHRLVDLGNVAVPQLIAALEDRRFTRSMEPRFNGMVPPRAMRVSEVAQKILEHLSGRNFYGAQDRDGKFTRGTRQLAEAWWAEVQSKGEKQPLIEATSGGGAAGVRAARKLVEKFPADALPAIEAGIQATPEEGYRGEFVEVAGLLPGNLPLAFLRAQLTPEHGVHAQVYAANALFQRGQPEAVPAMIDAWHRIQPSLPNNEGDAFFKVGRIISFLATSGDLRAIETLEHEAKTTPVQVRLALVRVFCDAPFSGGGSGPMVSIRDHVEKLPVGEAGAAIERLLVTALDDTERCFGPEGFYKNASFKDPRICDMAAFVLSTRWPDQYSFRWSARAAECDPQITRMRDQWRREHGLPPSPLPPPRTSIPPAAEADVAPLVDAFAAAADEAARAALTAKIAETFGLGALPLVRERLEKSHHAVFRPLAVDLASLVREIRIETNGGGRALPPGPGELMRKILNGERLDQLAHALQAEVPPNASGVIFVAERTGDDGGFHLTVTWLPGKVGSQAGWSREMAVRAGDKTVYREAHWAAENGVVKETLYRGMAEAFEKARQAEIDAPIFVRFRLQRGGNQ